MRVAMMSNPTPHKRQSGVALVIVLLILAMMTAVAATMTERLYWQFQRSSNTVNYQQAYWYALGVEQLAKVGIQESFDDGDTINLSQAWATRNQVYPLDYGQATGRIYDRQACFNINVLASVTQTGNATDRPYLVRILRSLLEEEGVDSYQSEVIADSAWEYVDSNTITNSPTGVESEMYESMHPAYLAPNSFMADISELRAVYKVSGDIMAKVTPMLCALPTDDWRLNVNTITEKQAPLLVAMFSPYLSENNAVQLIKSRPSDGWASVTEFLGQTQISSIDSATVALAKAYLDVDSAYFEMDAQVLVGDSRIRVRSLMYSKNRKTVTVIRRRFGGISERVSDRPTDK